MIKPRGSHGRKTLQPGQHVQQPAPAERPAQTVHKGHFGLAHPLRGTSGSSPVRRGQSGTSAVTGGGTVLRLARADFEPRAAASVESPLAFAPHGPLRDEHRDTSRPGTLDAVGKTARRLPRV